MESETLNSPVDHENNPPVVMKSTFKKWAPLGVIASILGIAWVMGWFDYLSLSSLIMHRETLGALVADHYVLSVLAYIVMYAGLVAISFPGASLLTIAAGFLFGGWLGAAATVIAATLGAVIIFEIARTSFGEAMQKRTGKFVEKMRKGFQENAFSYLLTLRLTPIFPFWVMNIVPALLNMKLMPYAVATFLGIIPGTIAYSFIGSGLDSVIMAQETANPGCAANGTCQIDPGSLITTDVIIAMVGLGLISLMPVIVKKFRNKPAQN
ncbi:MAG: TVP38/TMEM64 family protein [Salaquimonas sp.]